MRHFPSLCKPGAGEIDQHQNGSRSSVFVASRSPIYQPLIQEWHSYLAP